MTKKYKPEGFSLDIFKQRYAFTDEETFDEACMRVANQMAIAESPDKYQKYKEKFYEELATNRFVPGGRIWYGAGRANPNMLNCFVLNNNLDSKEGWGNLSKDMIITSMHGGGVGIDFSDIRPKGATINKQKGSAPGPLELMKLINGNGGPIRAGGARRTAMMFSLNLTHPDILDFIDIKKDQKELTLSNMSITIHNTEEFIQKIKEDGDIELSWKGKYKKSIKASKIWEIIVDNAYNGAEPGILNMELANKENPLFYHTNLITSNPCGEQIMSANSSCCLGHLVLHRFITNNKVDYEQLGQTIKTAVRFLDNVLSVNTYPLPEMKEVSEKNRRIGLGITGLADFLALIGLKYGSDEGNKLVDKLFRFISKSAYETSVMLAVEKGSFEVCNPELHIKSGYVKRMTPKIKSLISEHGIRNSTLLTCAPTGTVSILSGNCSGGIEPMFSPAYERRFWVKDERKTELIFHPLFKKFMNEGKSVDHFIGASELTVREHLEVQKIIQKHVDSAVSKTVNMSNDYQKEDMAKLWLEYLPYLKGTTFYREDSRKFIDENGNEQEPPLKAIPLEEAIERFNEGEDITEEAIEQQCKSGTCDI